MLKLFRILGVVMVIRGRWFVEKRADWVRLSLLV